MEKVEYCCQMVRLSFPPYPVGRSALLTTLDELHRHEKEGQDNAAGRRGSDSVVW